MPDLATKYGWMDRYQQLAGRFRHSQGPAAAACPGHPRLPGCGPRCRRDSQAARGRRRRHRTGIPGGRGRSRSARSLGRSPAGGRPERRRTRRVARERTGSDVVNVRPIIDAGPSLNFFATNRERLLFARVGPLHMPETVHAEVQRKSRRDQRFASARASFTGSLPSSLKCCPTSRPRSWMRQSGGSSASQRTNAERKAKDLGELMVVAHAVVAAEQGHHVTVMIDDGDGRRIATAERRRLERLSAQGRTVGSIGLISTHSVLTGAAGSAELPDRGAMRELYGRCGHWMTAYRRSKGRSCCPAICGALDSASSTNETGKYNKWQSDHDQVATYSADVNQPTGSCGRRCGQQCRRRHDRQIIAGHSDPRSRRGDLNP